MAAFTLPEGTQALLFDLDGTLIDSMPSHQAAWIEWHRRHGLPMDEPAFFAATAGRSNHEILQDMLPGRSAAEVDALADEKERLYRERAATGLALIAGAQAYVEAARAARLRLAICTASTPANMALAFARFGLDAWVDTITSPADGLRGKPHPDIFLEAARRLGAAPARCVVFEDAPLGIEAARRAGMQAVALTTTLPAADFAGFDNLLAVAPDFTGFSTVDILGVTENEGRDTMKTINVRELRATIPRLKEALAQSHELVLVSNGEPVARILPMTTKPKLASLAEHRARMPMLPVPSEVLIREERDRR